MKVLFVHDHGVHAAHRAWAESVGAVFLDSNPKSMKGFMLPVQARLIRTKFSDRYDAILAEGGTCLPLAVKLKKMLGCKLIMISADSMFYDMPAYNPVRRAYIKRVIRRIDGTVAVSSLSKEHAKKYVKCPIEIVHPYANIREFIKVKPGLTSKNIIFVGKHRPDKNIEGLIKCFRDIKKELPDATLTLIGGLIEERVPRELLGEEGIISLGHTNFEMIKKKLSESKLFMHISWFDPCPVSVTESMAAGVPTLISDGVGNKDFVPKDLVFTDDFAEHAICLLDKNLNKLSKECRKISLDHTKKKSQKAFQTAFRRLAG
jgi:glycosyltransferase involved in cell wall biosynthesis